jgi:hypothetical protein
LTSKKTVEITCDGCGKDLAIETPILTYYLELSSFCSKSRIIGSNSPEFEEDKHFCDSRCLKKWIGKDELK